MQKIAGTTRFFGLSPAEWLFIGLVVFLVLFPKGGFKLGGVPITWGYAIIGSSIVVTLPRVSYCGNFLRTQRPTLAAYCCLLPIQLLLVYSLGANGVGDAGFAVSDIVDFFVLPFAFLCILPAYLSKVRIEKVVSTICWCVFLAAGYGIFLFWWRLHFGSYIEIPYLTVNVADAGTLGDKFNSRPDGLFKLISTYNNGNQYGVSTLLLLPLVDEFDRNVFRRIVIRIALFLTLSRTVWIGIVLNELIQTGRYLWNDLSTSSFLRVRYSTLKKGGRITVAGIMVLTMTLAFSGVSFLFDSSLGGRANYLDSIQGVTFLPSQPVEQFVEIIYYSALSMLGVSGLLAIILLFISPLLLVIQFRYLLQTKLQVAALLGLLLYIPLAAMDGSLNYIPTMAFYWMLWMFLLHKTDSDTDNRYMLGRTSQNLSVAI